MKTRIAAACGLMLTIGTAMAGTWIYEQGKPDAEGADAAKAASLNTREVTPEMIAAWKLAATSSNHEFMRVPL